MKCTFWYDQFAVVYGKQATHFAHLTKTLNATIREGDRSRYDAHKQLQYYT